MKQELYEDVYTKQHRFSFGKNWLSFLKHVNAERLKDSQKAMQSFLGTSLKGKTFIDVGCGSGLSSVAAYTLGTKKLVSIDADAASVAATEQLRESAVEKRPWVVKHGSILNKKFVQSLGTYDVVYSWGVLHHTGNMHQAFDNVDLLVKKKGLLFIAIYNDSKRVLEGTSPFWAKIKRMYNNGGPATKKILEWKYTAYLLLGITLSGKNPVRYVRDYHKQRGMEFTTDVKDWLGGYPYEYASVKEIEGYFAKKGYTLKKHTQARSIGCNEFLLQKQ